MANDDKAARDAEIAARLEANGRERFLRRRGEVARRLYLAADEIDRMELPEATSATPYSAMASDIVRAVMSAVAACELDNLVEAAADAEYRAAESRAAAPAG